MLKSQFQTQLGHCYLATVLTDIAQRLMFRHHLNDHSGLAGGSGFSFLALGPISITNCRLLTKASIA